MNIPLQTWLSTQKISKEALSSFEESFICFKVGAYKAALLFAYLGFMNVVRDRLVFAPSPTGINPNHWAGIQANAKNPETWEKIVFDAIQQKNPAPVFILSDDLRNQLKYWKDRRNDCAHSRQNKIIAAHVEAFYAFIESNLGKFVVNGSRNEMMRRCLDYFNPSLISPSEPIAPIIHDLVNALTVAEYQAFVSDVSAEFDSSLSPTSKTLGIRNPNTVRFLEACFLYGTDELREACKAYLITDDTLLVSFLRQHPERAYVLQDQPQKVRLIWHDLLFNGSRYNDFAVLCSFLRASLIPPEQIPEAIKCAVNSVADVLPNDLDLKTLVTHGFYQALEEAITDDNLLSSFNWANSNKELVIKYLSDNPISQNVALAIYRAFNSEHYAWHLAEYLNRFFAQNQNKRAEYRAFIGGDPYIGVPQAINSLANP
ncbi:hypothetical protein [Thermodesulfomicrobium sp. WS]|uniref:hypothetical protein n=1 Tax=Thermodesulfomicrobium sp. WS TaxID=3004129 RepID=UPI002492169F|nr:hypothetical protein [Thermodesulfomicrobium sp. WS]